MLGGSSAALLAAPLLLLLFAAVAVEVRAGGYRYGSDFGGAGGMSSCPRWSPCHNQNVRCPAECPSTRPSHPRSKFCYLDCYSPKCEAACKSTVPDCNNKGSGCYDPRFIGGDGVVFYFHGKKDGHFALVSDPGFQINARFIGLRPEGRARDFTWIQGLAFLFGSHAFTVGAARARSWDGAVDHLRFSYDGEPLELPEGHRSSWASPDGRLAVERTGRANTVTVRLEGMAEASVGAVPVTEEDDRIHGYGIPSDDCFAHLEVQFRFPGRLSPAVEGVLGRTYQPEYVNPAKRGVAMPVVGGEDKYRTPSLLSAQCAACIFVAQGSEPSAIPQVSEEKKK